MSTPHSAPMPHTRGQTHLLAVPVEICGVVTFLCRYWTRASVQRRLTFLVATISLAV